MDYEVVVVKESFYLDAAEELANKIREKLNSGWKLQGGVSISRCETEYASGTVMAQALIKE